MSAAQSAEAQARLNVSLREIVNFFDEAGIRNHSIELLNEFIDKHQTFEFLELVESYGSCNAFIDHERLLGLLYNSWSLLHDGYIIERKVVSKKIKLMKEDKKTDPEVLVKQENLLLDIDQKKAIVTVACVRLRTMTTIPMEEFKKDPEFDYMQRHKEKLEFRKQALSKK